MEKRSNQSEGIEKRGAGKKIIHRVITNLSISLNLPNVDQCVGKFGARCVDLTKFGEIIVNNLDLIHLIVDQLLAILVINR